LRPSLFRFEKILFSLRVRHSPVLGNGANVPHNLAMARPRNLDGFGCANTSATGVASGAEPMVLRSTSGSRSQAVIGDTVVGATEEFLLEMRVVGYETSSKVSLLLLEDFEHAIFILVGPLCHNLEGSK